MKLLGIFAVLATLATGSITVLPSSARSWIDGPLPGTVLPVAPVEIVAHSYDDAGVATVVLSVDGTPVAEIVPDGAGDRFVTIRTRWNPPGPGTYLLQVQERAADQTPGAAATAVVQIGGASETTSTSTTTSTTAAATTTTTMPPTTSTTVAATTTTAPPTTTSTSTTAAATTTTTVAPTTTTTTVPCAIGTPVATAPPSGSATGSTVTLQWSYSSSSCVPASFAIQISLARDFSTIESGGTVGGSQRSWTTTVRCGFDYYWRVRAEDVDAGSWSSTSTFTTATRICI